LLLFFSSDDSQNHVLGGYWYITWVAYRS